MADEPTIQQDAQSTPEAEAEVKQETPVLTDAEEKLRNRVITLMNSGTSKESFRPKDFRAFLDALAENPDMLGNLSKESMRKIAKGEERTPKALGDKVAEALAETDVPERGKRWARGMLAIRALVPDEMLQRDNVTDEVTS